MKDYKKFILDTLLDKYEEGKHFKAESKINRRVMMPFDKDFYDIENASVKNEIHYVLAKLCEKDLIHYTWLKQQKGNIIDKVYLNLLMIDEAYMEIDRKPKKTELDEMLGLLQKLRSQCNIEWIIAFIDYSVSEIVEKRNYPRYIPKEERQRDLLFKALKGIHDKGNEEILERIFSRKYLGNSKSFEKKVRGRITTLIKDFMFEGNDIEEEEYLQEALLQEIGIIKSSQDLSFCGKVEINLEGNVIDFRNLIYGTSMNTNTIKNFSIYSIGFKRFITIENKACYLEYIKQYHPDELVVFLGGFYSPIKRHFIEKVYKYIKDKNIDVSFLHWGDIDYGGICIFNILKTKIIHELQPLNMDKATLDEYISYCDPIDETYAEKLRKLMIDSRFDIFNDVLLYMVEKSIRLEQESYYA